jgi:hypothetical protein
MKYKKVDTYSLWDEEYAYKCLYGDLFYCVPHYVKFYEKKKDGGIKLIWRRGGSIETSPLHRDTK